MSTARRRKRRRQDPAADGAAGDPRLCACIRYLNPTPRGVRACRKLKVETVGDFLDRDRAEFTALRNCGDRTYEDLLARVREFLAEPDEVKRHPSETDRRRPLLGLIRNPRAEKAFLSLGITTVGEFLDTPKEELLEVEGFGERSYWEVAQRIREITGHQSCARELLPELLLRFRITDLDLPASLQDGLSNLGIHSIGDLFESSSCDLEGEPGIGREGIEAIRGALCLLVRVGIDRTVSLSGQDDGKAKSFDAMQAQLLSVLDDTQRQLFCAKIGLEGQPKSRMEIGVAMRLSHEEVTTLEESTRLTFRERAPGILAKLREEAVREERAFEGMIHADHLAPGTLLHDAARSTGDVRLPLRLLRFCFAREYYVYGNLLSTLTPASYHRFGHVMRRATARRHLPLPVADLEAKLLRIVDPVPRGLMLHLLEHRHHLSIYIDPERGEIIEQSSDSVADRLLLILRERAEPMLSEDLLFAYRDRHRRGRLQHIEDHIRKDKRFLQVGESLWSLRESHLDELEMATSEAERIASLVLAGGERLNVFGLQEEMGVSTRGLYMILDGLRRHSGLRDLGRGDFCPRGNKMSSVMQRILEDFQRAMGEVVLSRFLDNQPRGQRRLIERLLHKNRLFVMPCEDRVDLVTNYPFNDERLKKLTSTVSNHLDDKRGYASTAELIEVLNKTDLGGTWLTEHLLLDVLRRHGDFELLPGGLVAEAALGLAGWIRQRARETIRQAGAPLTPEEVAAEVPDLAAFADCLAELLDEDPMMQCADGVHYALL